MKLRLGSSSLALEAGRPILMGIVNAGPDSFSDPGRRSVETILAAAVALRADGAALVDVGGESGRTDRAAVPVEEEIERVAEPIARIAAQGIPVSVDTWRAPVARAALEAGAAMVNDVSGLADPDVAAACAEAGAALVVTHTRVPPKTKGFPAYDDVIADVVDLLGERSAAARAAGVAADALVLDPGIDLAKTPAQSAEVLRRLPEVAALGLPLLLAVSRKDVVGALTGRSPADRGAGTLAACGAAAAGGAAILRVHDVAATRDYLVVREALSPGGEVPADLALPEGLRREPGAEEAA